MKVHKYSWLCFAMITMSGCAKEQSKHECFAEMLLSHMEDGKVYRVQHKKNGWWDARELQEEKAGTMLFTADGGIFYDGNYIGTVSKKPSKWVAVISSGTR